MSPPDALPTDLFALPGRVRKVDIQPDELPGAKAEAAAPQTNTLMPPDENKVQSPQDLYAAWQTKRAPAERHRLLSSLDPVIGKALTSFAGGDNRYRVQAYMLANQAVDSYDPQKNVQLTTHVSNHLQGLNRVVADRSQTVHIPENRILDSRKINQLTLEYQDEHGHEPSMAYISDKLGLSRGRVEKAMDIKPQVPEFSLLSDKGHSLVGVSPDIIQTAMDYVYHDATEKDRKIIEWLTGYGGVKKIPKIQIAKRLKMTPAGVSFRVNQIMKRLQSGVETGETDE